MKEKEVIGLERALQEMEDRMQKSEKMYRQEIK